MGLVSNVNMYLDNSKKDYYQIINKGDYKHIYIIDFVLCMDL